MGRRWTESQRLEKSSQMRQHFDANGHPRSGIQHTIEAKEKMRKPKTRKAPTLAYCTVCGKPLKSVESATAGAGPKCQHQIQESQKLKVLTLA